MKRRIRQNVWDNWNGYEGTKKVIEFGLDQQKAECWLKGVEEMEQPFLPGEFKRRILKGLTTPNMFVESVMNNEDLWRTYGLEHIASGYAERGYSDPPKGTVLLGNWNSRQVRDKADWHKVISEDDRPAKFAKIAESCGYGIDWSDEYYICDNCNKAFRSQPDSYSWTQSGSIEEDGVYCEDCLRPEDVLTDLEDDPRKALTQNINPEDYGYVLLKDGFEHGLYGGQNDSPEVIANSLRKLGIRRFIFKIDSVGQFDAHFSVYVHEEEFPKEPIGEIKSALPYDPATELSKALKGEKSDYYRVETRTITPEQFVQGKGI